MASKRTTLDDKALPKMNRSESASIGSDLFLIGGENMGRSIKEYDWTKTSIGPIETWPSCLKNAVSLMLHSPTPLFIWWGKDEMLNFYNDAYIPILGGRHPEALGASAPDIWPEIIDELAPLVDAVFSKGESVYKKNQRLVLNRSSEDEETYFTFSYSPLIDDAGSVSGLFCTVLETTEEVLALQKLQESEQRFRHLADTAPMYIAMADESGDAVYFNRPWLEFTGKKLEEMKGLGWLSVLHPEDAPKFEKDFLDAFTEHIPISKEYRFRRADGEYRWMLAIGAPRFTPDGHFMGYFGTYTDFHELKQAQFALQASEERFRTLIEKSADAVQLVTAKGEIIYSSDSIKNVLGYAPEEIAHHGVDPYLHPKDREYFYKQFKKLVDTPNGQIVLQYRVKHRDGSWAWVETVGVNHLQTPNINALVGNFRNITEQKLSEEKLRRSEERFRVLAENIPNLAWMARADGTIYWYNSRWYEYTGTTPTQMKDKGWQRFHDPKYLPTVIKGLRRSFKTGEAFEMVFPLKGADKVFKPFLTRMVPVLSQDGTVEQWIGTNTDISEQLKIKRVEERTKELEEIADQLAIQRKELLELNQAKDEFISLASHQLRTPATGVKQYIGMLLEGFAGELTKEQRRFAEQANESNEREILIINDLLQVAQADAGRLRIHKESVDLKKLLEDIIEEQASNFNNRQQAVSFRYSGADLTAHVDEDRIRMVLENIVDNAGKYTLPGKEIKIMLSRLRSDKIRIRIKDEGVGIGDEDIERIFSKFVRADNPLSHRVGGNGLGLYLAQKIVTLHGGKITVKSIPDKGSTFTVTLPVGP